MTTTQFDTSNEVDLETLGEISGGGRKRRERRAARKEKREANRARRKGTGKYVGWSIMSVGLLPAFDLMLSAGNKGKAPILEDVRRDGYLD